MWSALAKAKDILFFCHLTLDKVIIQWYNIIADRIIHKMKGKDGYDAYRR